MAQDNAPQGLRDSIVRIADAAQSGRRPELNDALSDFAMLAFPLLSPFIDSQLRRRKVGGPDGTVAEASDVLNRLLFKMLDIAWRCTAPDDERALAWLLAVTKNEVRDQTKRPIERLFKLIDRLRGRGYHHPSWETGYPNKNQEQGDDGDFSDGKVF